MRSEITEKKVIEKLNAMYPDKIIRSLHRKDICLYNWLRRYCSKNELHFRTYIKSLGFKYAKKTLSTKKKPHEEIIKKKLLKLYPDKKVEELFVKNRSLYNQILYYAKTNKMGIDDYVDFLGFKLDRKKGKLQVVDKDFILKRLTMLYPAFVYPSISDIETRDRDFYKILMKYVRDNGESLSVIFNSLGFEKKGTYDRLSIRRLVNDYKARVTDIANLYGVSRQTIESEMKKNVNRIAFWETSKLDDVDMNVFEGMVKHFLKFHEVKDKKYKIFSNMNRTNPSFALLVTSNNKTEILFEVTKQMRNNLLKQHFHIYNDLDFLKLNELNKLLLVNGNFKRSVMDEELRLLNELTRDNKSSPYTREILLDHLGFNDVEILDRRFISDDEIIRVLDYFYNSELGGVKIPINSDEYYRMVYLAKRRGFTLGEFIESFGYCYKRNSN